MPGVLVDDKLDPFAQAYSLPPPSPFFCGSPLSVPFQQPLPAQSPFRHYIPVLTRVIPAGSYDEELSSALSQLSPLSYHRAGLGHSVDVNPTSELLKCQGDDEGSSEPPPALQISRWGKAGSLTMTEASLAALHKFLPSNFENGAGEEEDSAAEWAMLDIYSSDEFRMYEFKVRRCMRGRSHDWTECPFAHPGEKARRRDPRRLHYSGTPCADFRKGGCKKGDACEFAHGVFECWLHPARYRTQPCKDGRCCRRRVCFFAHTPEQLRLLSPVSPSSPPLSSSLRLTAMEAPLEPSVTSTASPSSSSSQLFTVMEAPAEAFPVSGPSLYSSSLRFSSIEAPSEAFPASGSSLSSSPLRNAAMEPAAEAFTTHASSLQNEACFNRVLSASLSSNRAHGFSSSPSVVSAKSSFSAIAPVSLSPPLSPSESPPESPMNWSPRGLSYAFPLQQSAHVYPSYHGQSLHAGHSQASLPSVPAHRRHLEKLNSSPSLAIPTTHDLSFSALSSPTSSSPTAQSLQHIEDLVYLLKQADLTQQEPLWLQARAAQASMAQQSKFSSGPSPLRRASQSVPATPTKMGFRNKDPNLCYFDDDREASEPKLERVESGRGLRAQIFESLIKSQQQSCSTDPESNPSPVSP